MSLILKDEGEYDKWHVKIEQHYLTDVLVSVYDIDPQENKEKWAKHPLFAFGIGELLKGYIEMFASSEGDIRISDQEYKNVERWAEQLEIYATLIRSALRTRAEP